MNGRTPPAHLSDASKRFWRRVLREYELETHHLAILTVACEALDRLTEAREAITRDGAYIAGRFGIKAHPALAVENAARGAALKAIRELGLDLDSPATTSPSRPPSRWRGR